LFGAHGEIRFRVETEILAVVVGAVEDEEAIVDGQKNSCRQKPLVLPGWDGHGEALQLAGEVAKPLRIKGVSNLGAERRAFISVWNQNRFGVIIDQMELLRAGFKPEKQEIVRASHVCGPAVKDAVLIHLCLMLPKMDPEIGIDGFWSK
jgi:hypothetical protein